MNGRGRYINKWLWNQGGWEKEPLNSMQFPTKSNYFLKQNGVNCGKPSQIKPAGLAGFKRHHSQHWSYPNRYNSQRSPRQTNHWETALMNNLTRVWLRCGNSKIFWILYFYIQRYFIFLTIIYILWVITSTQRFYDNLKMIIYILL